MNRRDDLYRVQCGFEYDTGRHGAVGGTKSMVEVNEAMLSVLLCTLKVRRSISPSCSANFRRKVRRTCPRGPNPKEEVLGQGS